MNNRTASDRIHQQQTESAPKTERYQYQTRWEEEEPLGTAIVVAVAAVTGIEPLELPVLAGSIDVDALEALIESGDRSVTVSFQYAACEVRVRGDRTITLETDQ